MYDGYTFTGGSSVKGVIHIDYDVRNVTIRNSIVKAGPQNGITINADGGTEVRNIRFENVTVMSQPRMGFECTDRSGNGMWSGIDLVDMVFEPQGNQAISFDGPAGAGDSTVDNVTIKGAGTSTTQPWGNAFEINGPSNMTVRNCHFYQPRNHVLNLQRHSSEPSGWVLENNVFDTTTRHQSVKQERDSQVVLGLNVVGGVYRNNTIIASDPGGSVAYLSACRDMDWRTSTWHDATNRAGYSTPTRVDGCSGNLF